MYVRRAVTETYTEWVFQGLCKLWREFGCCPTTRELAAELDIRKATVSKHLRLLVKAGRVERHQYTRGWRVPGLKIPRPEVLPVQCDRCGMLANLEQNANGEWVCGICVGEVAGKLPYYWRNIRQDTPRASINGRICRG